MKKRLFDMILELLYDTFNMLYGQNNFENLTVFKISWATFYPDPSTENAKNDYSGNPKGYLFV